MSPSTSPPCGYPTHGCVWDFTEQPRQRPPRPLRPLRPTSLSRPSTAAFHLRCPCSPWNRFISTATGLDVDSDELWTIAARNRNLIRALNVRRGLRRSDEKPPADHWKKREPEMEQKLLDEYYAFKGWTDDGIPTKARLDELGLEYVSEDFIRRGILPAADGTPAQVAVAATTS